MFYLSNWLQKRFLFSVLINYTPQNNLRTNSFIFSLFNIGIDVCRLELISGQKRYLQHLFDKLNVLAISVVIKMSMAPTRSNREI